LERFTRCRAIYVLCVNRICDNYAFSKYRRCRYDVEEKIKIDSGQQKGVDGGDNR
jgi:CRISPR/Cas system-associated protein Csx1